jgi:hypothetical protein
MEGGLEGRRADTHSELTEANLSTNAHTHKPSNLKVTDWEKRKSSAKNKSTNSYSQPKPTFWA